ncbi:helix-turn-helix transcriptional regulator [Corallococcus exiguus]|uniref:response regulator transcription factor n=1 Tax=Corallococcus exiguus TaxID=83462 RepID=UPI001A8F542F|nr:helix-turn-helix transcriptional regulator [Corallococcus exiguus]MBN8466721.1 helix-turn-helix transcriptional regulator [Corallococcus exiguus]
MDASPFNPAGVRVTRERYSVSYELTVERTVEEVDGEEDDDALDGHGSGQEEQHALLRRIAFALEQEAQADDSASPDIAVEVWKGVLAGEWCLFDHFEHQGRHFLVARQGAAAGSLAALTLRERQVVEHVVQGHSNKLMALELGLTQSTVATHLRRALTKLRLRSRSELIRSIQVGGLPALAAPTGSVPGR